MADQLSQAEIDVLLKQYEAEIGQEDWKNDPSKYDVYKYHRLICQYCHKIIFTENLNIHVIVSNDKCRVSDRRCKYVSKAWLLDKKKNNIAGWRRSYPLIETPLEKKVMKKIEVNKK